MAECESHNMYLNLGGNTSSEKQFRLKNVSKYMASF